MEPEKKLCRRQAAFAREIVVDWNATKAAERAGYAESSAHVTGCRLLSNAKVQAEIAIHAQAAASRVNLTQERVIKELMRIAFVDMGGLAKWNGDWVRLTDSETLTEDQLAAVCEVRQTRDGVHFKLYDKQRALDTLAKYLEMFKEAPPIEVNNYVVEVPEKAGDVEAWRQRFSPSAS